MDLEQLKEWLKIDYENEDDTLSSLLSASEMIIKQATGVELTDVQADGKAFNLYILVQRIIITNLYENRDSEGKENLGLTSLYIQLETYKLQQNSTVTSQNEG